MGEIILYWSATLLQFVEKVHRPNIQEIDTFEKTWLINRANLFENFPRLLDLGEKSPAYSVPKLLSLT